MTVACGATPVFADIISPIEPTIDPECVEKLITPQTKAVVVMHYGGYLCRMAELVELCKRRGIALIEDACHAVGAAYLDTQQRHPHGAMAGAMGDVSAFSFFSNKNLATGEGGMVVTDRDDLADRLRLLRSHGMTTLTWDRHKGHANSYDVVESGYNYRLDDLHAALGREQLKKLGSGNLRRKELTAQYRELLNDLDGWSVPFDAHSGDSACHLMAVLAPDTATRNKVVSQLSSVGIQTSLHYPCITEFSAFSTWHSSLVPHSREFASRVITLPLHPLLTKTTIKDVTCALGRAAHLFT
jgi:dTDP-4-amino-4,6-dideoxygalactose transaminase